MYLLLEPHLRPATPDADNPQSMALFEEHKQLAQEYLKVFLKKNFKGMSRNRFSFQVQTEIAYVSQRKNNLLAAQSQDQQQRKLLKDLQAEKESLVLVRQLLTGLRDNNEARNQLDNWVLVQRDEANTD